MHQAVPAADEDGVGQLQPPRGNIRLNTELVKKSRDRLEYVVVHEMLHLLEPRHSERLVALLEKRYPRWREAPEGTERVAAGGGTVVQLMAS